MDFAELRGAREDGGLDPPAYGWHGLFSTVRQVLAYMASDNS
jgi:hypothetical protein